MCQSTEALDDAHTEALDATESLTGHRFTTCPYAGAYAPWVHRAVDADEHGLSDDSIANGPPPRALVQAIKVLRVARKKRDAEDLRIAKQKRNE